MESSRRNILGRGAYRNGGNKATSMAVASLGSLSGTVVLDLNSSPKSDGSPTGSCKPTPLSSLDPPMFKSLLPAVRLQLTLCNRLSTIPFEWDEDNGCLRILRSKFHLKLCQTQMIIHVCYTLLMVSYFLSPQSMNTIKSSTRMVGLAFLVCFGATMLMRLTFWHKRAEVVHLINNFIKFETTYLPPCRTGFKGDKISRALMTLGLLTSAGLPGLMLTMLSVNPCKVPHLGYILFRLRDGNEGCMAPPWSLRIAILSFDTWMWANCITPACFFAFQVFFPGLKCLSFYLSLLSSISRSVNYAEKFKSIHSKDRYCFKVYHHLQVLARLYNFCLQTVFVPTQIGAACLVIIIGLYTCIKLHSEVPMPGFAFFPLLSLDGFSMIFISQVAAGVYTRSRRLVNEAKKSRIHERRSWYTKTARATAMIKIRFGSTSFIDQMTPLVFMNFCFTQTVSLVLLS